MQEAICGLLLGCAEFETSTKKKNNACTLSPRHADAVSEMSEWCPNATKNINLEEEISESKTKELDTCSSTLLLIMEGFAGD